MSCLQLEVQWLCSYHSIIFIHKLFPIQRLSGLKHPVNGINSHLLLSLPLHLYRPKPPNFRFAPSVCSARQCTASVNIHTSATMYCTTTKSGCLKKEVIKESDADLDGGDSDGEREISDPKDGVSLAAHKQTWRRAAEVKDFEQLVGPNYSFLSVSSLWVVSFCNCCNFSQIWLQKQTENPTQDRYLTWTGKKSQQTKWRRTCHSSSWWA